MIKFGSKLPINWSKIPPPPYPINGYRLGNTTDNLVLNLGSGGSFDDERILGPHVYEHGGTIYLFYQGYNGSIYQTGLATAHLSGFNGKNFIKYENNPIDLGGQGTVFYDEDDAIWKAWYISGTVDVSARINYATANNPFGPWTSYVSNPVLSASEVWEGTSLQHPSVWKEGTGSYKMLYSGNSVIANSQIGLATSTDGITWTKYGSNPVISNSASDEWRSVSVFCPNIPVFQDGLYHILLNGKGSAGYSKVGYAYSSDLIAWTMGKNNPILQAGREWEWSSSPPGENEYPLLLQINGKQYIYYDCWYGNPVSIGVVVI